MNPLRNLLLLGPLAAGLLLMPGVSLAQFTFTTNNGAITITGYAGTSGTVVIPAATNGLPVTGIGGYVFNQDLRLTNVIIPDSVLSLGDGIFNGCTNLVSVSIGQGVTNIGDWDFYFCTSLKNVTLPQNVMRIGNYAFDSCLNLTNTIIPNKVISIGDDAFWTCTNLTSIAIPDSVKSLGNYAFGFCTGVTNVLMGNSITNIGHYAFQYCSSLTDITIPDSVTDIGIQAFLDCTNLTNVTIGSQVAKIWDQAFAGCTGLTNITIPKSVSYIGYKVFAGNSSLMTIETDPANSYYSSLAGVLFDKSQTTVVAFPPGQGGSYAIPSSVTTIRLCAFLDCFNLTQVTLGTNVNSIENAAFAGCINLTNVYLESIVRPNVGYNVFAGDDQVTIYYLLSIIGWVPFQDGQAVQWLPQIDTSDSHSGLGTKPWGFNISWARGQTVIVEACTNLSNPVWEPVETNTVATGSVYFSDSQWTNYPGRFYRVRSPE